MKSLRILSCGLLVALLASCTGGNKKLEKMIPADATAVVSVNVPSIFKNARMMDDEGKITYPQELLSLLGSKGESMPYELVSALPSLGLNPDNNLYVFLTDKTFRYVVLASVDEDKARPVMEQRMEGKFAAQGDVPCLRKGDYTAALHDGVLLLGRCNSDTQDDQSILDAARSILYQNAKSVRDVDDIKSCLEADNDVNAYFTMPALKTVIAANHTLQSVADAVPLIGLVTDSDIKALTVGMKFSAEGATLQAQVKADDSSDFVTLLQATQSAPDSTFLQAIPNSMDFVMSVSVNGSQLAKLEPVQKSLNLLGGMGTFGHLDVKSIFESIDGPIALGLSPSYMSGSGDGDLLSTWNVALALKSKQPEQVVQMITRFAAANGQTDFVKDGSHVFDYEDMPVTVGNMGNIVYVRRLDHQLTEGSYFDEPDIRARFARSPVGFYLKNTAAGHQSFLSFGFSDRKNGDGIFYTANEKDNAALTFVEMLCGLLPGDSQPADSEEEEGFVY